MMASTGCRTWKAPFTSLGDAYRRIQGVCDPGSVIYLCVLARGIRWYAGLAARARHWVMGADTVPWEIIEGDERRMGRCAQPVLGGSDSETLWRPMRKANGGFSSLPMGEAWLGCSFYSQCRRHETPSSVPHNSRLNMLSMMYCIGYSGNRHPRNDDSLQRQRSLRSHRSERALEQALRVRAAWRYGASTSV